MGWVPAAAAPAGCVRRVAPDTGTNWTEDCVVAPAVSRMAVVVVPTVRGCEVGVATAVGALIVYGVEGGRMMVVAVPLGT